MKIVHKFMSQTTDNLNRKSIEQIKHLIGAREVVKLARDEYATLDSYNAVIKGEFTFDDINRVIESVNSACDHTELTEETKRIIITYMRTFMNELEEDLHKSMLSGQDCMFPDTNLLAQVDKMPME